MKKKKINEEYFDSEELKGKDEINFLKGETREELKKLSDIKPRGKVLQVAENLLYNNPFIKNLQISHGKLSGKKVLIISKKIDVYDNRFSAISEFIITITFNNDGSFSTSTKGLVQVADTDKGVNDPKFGYKTLFDEHLNKNVPNIFGKGDKELSQLVSNEIYDFFKKWNKWSYSVTGKDTLNNKEVEFKDDMVKDKFKGGSFKMEVDPNFNPQFNSKSYVFREYEKFIKESKRSNK